MPFFDYFATGPLANWVQLNSGPGAAPLLAASAAYTGVGEALGAAAASADGSSAAIKSSWEGLSGPRAEAALRRHTAWVREQAAVAQQMSGLAVKAGQAHLTAVATMPTLAEILANMVKRAAAASAVVASAGTPMAPLTTLAVAEAELEYLVLRTRAAVSMSGYEVSAIDTLAELVSVPIAPPPPLVTGGGFDGTPGYSPPDTTGSLNDLVNNGPDSNLLSDTNGPGPQQSVSDGTQSVSDATDPGSDLGQGGSHNERPMSDIQHALSPDDSTYAAEHGLDPQAHDGLFGTTPNSTTLAGLTGGFGGFMVFSMMNGGLGSISGAATGFRMPGNWTPGTGTAFGAGTGNTSAAPMSRTASRPGVSAPSARMRRRRKEEDKDKPAKVFIPGEQLDVPVLERPPAIGVIEYDEDDIQEDMTSDAVLVGVLDRFDAEAETADPETPR